MLTWVQQNLANILACLALSGVVFLGIFFTVRSRKRCKSACGCNCAGCPMGKCRK